MIQAGNVPGSLDTVHLDGTDDGTDDIVEGYVAGGGSLGDVDVFIDGEEDITVHANGGGVGQAWVVGSDGTLRALDFRLAAGYTFTAIEFDLNAPRTTGPPAEWDVFVSGFASDGSDLTVLLEDITNNSFVNVWGTGITRLTHVSFVIADGSPDLIGVGHIRVGGVAAIPEPTTWALMILGFGGAGAMLRRRRQVPA